MGDTEFLDVDGARIAYDVAGGADGQLVVCVPGMGDVRGLYRFLAPMLVESGYRVVTTDLRGHGESSTAQRYSDGAVGEDLVALIRHLGGPAVVIGESLGGGAAVCAAATAPELVNGLVLTSAFVRDGASPNLLMKAAMAAVGHSATLWGMFYRSMFKSGTPQDLGSYLAALKSNLREPGRMAALRAYFTAGSEGVSHVAEVRCPVRIVMGTKDADWPDPVAEAKWLHEALSGHATSVQTTLIDGGGHLLPAEFPERHAAIVREFLETVSA